MDELTTPWEVHGLAGDWRRQAERIGFVPTMGNLHAGHLRLVEVAKTHCDRVVVSIFVNPMQFGAGEDFSRYPRTLDADREHLQKLKVDMLFVPEVAEIYPGGHDNTSFVEVPGVSEGLEGANRPGHFRGVATVVNKLFNIVQPDVAVFGEKDFQQLLVIQHMVHDLAMPIEILGEPTVREPNGLALSSRNQYLTAAQREQAAGLHQTLVYVRERLSQNRVEHTDLEQDAIMRLERQGFNPDYVAIRNSETLREVKNHTEPMVILAAARLGPTRLIDNLRV